MRILFLLPIIILLLASCSMPGSTVTVTSQDASPTTTSKTEELQSTKPGTFADNVDSTIKHVNLRVSQWEYSPDVIEVNEGDTVIVHATSLDVPHSFTLPDFVTEEGSDATGGINVLLQKGITETLAFTADKKGEFRYGCDVVCGSGHTSMHGMLVVR